MNVKNKNCIRRLSWRSLWASRKRNIIAIIAIALTALLFTSIFTIAMSINSSYEMYAFRQIGGYNHGSFKNVTEEQAQKIAAHPNVKEVGRRIVIGCMDSGAFAYAPAEVSFMDDNCAKWGFVEPTTGRNPQSGNEIAMDTEALKLLGVEPEIGAQIELTYPVGVSMETTYDKKETFTLVGWWKYDDISPVHFINISEEYAKTVEAEAVSKGMAPFSIDLSVMLPSSVNIEGQMEQIDLDLGYSWEETGEGELVPIGVNWGYTTSQVGEKMDGTMVAAIAALLALVIFTGYLIIYNIFQISVTGDIRFYGLLKTIGVTPRQIGRIIRQQALFLCIAGIPVGLLLGYGIGVALTPIVMARTTLVGGISTTSTSPIIFLASALFALVTVLLSCARPGMIAAKVSPVEATKYTEVTTNKTKRRATRGAKVHQMAFANLGRNKSKTVLVVISLAFSVVLLNILVSFTGGFDMEKYLAKNACADFTVSTTDYFRNNVAEQYISQEQIEQIEANTSQLLSGCGYTLSGYNPSGWMSEEHWLEDVTRHTSREDAEAILAQLNRRGDLVEETAQIEGLDAALFEKLTVIDGDLMQVLQEGTNAIAVVVETDDYGNVDNLDNYPPLGSVQTITYIEEINIIDSRTGKPCSENTPPEFMELDSEISHDVDYTVCAYVTVPNAMSYRSDRDGYDFVLPVEKLKNDSRQEVIPMVYLFDASDDAAEAEAEKFLADWTGDMSGLMYESKALLRADFADFQNMFLLLGGLLCGIIGVVGILNFFNAIMTGILSRKREFAVLQAVGMTGKQLKAMLVYEGLFYALSSALLALVLSLAVSPLVGSLLEKMFWFFSANFTVIPVLLTIPVFALFGWLIPSIMYGQAAKQSIVERLRETE